MHFVTAKSLLSSQNGMNLYRGCQHGCIYCDSRSRCYGMDHPFEDIEVKENALKLLEAALKAKRKPCMIGTGSMSDPYIPLEEELRLTRKSLQLIDRYGFGATVLTKSTRILQDLDLLKRIQTHSKVVVQMTLTTMDESLCRILEPNVSTTRERVEALKTFQSEGIPTVVWLCPILPWLNDTRDNILGIVSCCADAGVKGILNFGMGLTLREGNREYFYSRLNRSFPGLSQQYIRTYGNAYEIPSPRSRELTKLFHDTCEEKGIWHNNDRIFRYLSEYEQTSKEEQLRFF